VFKCIPVLRSNSNISPLITWYWRTLLRVVAELAIDCNSASGTLAKAAFVGARMVKGPEKYDTKDGLTCFG